jgi:RNA polymerase sigma factor (TIGR02999 family)
LDAAVVRTEVRWIKATLERPSMESAAVNEVTHILFAIAQGHPSAASQLLPLVYEELRKLAAQKLTAESPDQTLQATALVHEAYLRLVDQDQAPHWNSRGHFFAAAAEAMRRILNDYELAQRLRQLPGL